MEAFIYAAAAVHTANSIKKFNANNEIKGTNERLKNPADNTFIDKGNKTNPELNSGKPDPKFNNVNAAVSVVAGYLIGAVIIDEINKRNVEVNQSFNDKKEAVKNNEPDNKVKDDFRGEMEKVCGKHLRDKDPNYWYNDLIDSQRKGYNRAYNEKYQRYLIEEDEEKK